MGIRSAPVAQLAEHLYTASGFLRWRWGGGYFAIAGRWSQVRILPGALEV